MTFDVAVVGAGIIGAACAMYCARFGLRTVVIERSLPASGATATGMGHIVLIDDSEPHFALTRYSRGLWDELVPQLPPEAEHWRCGTLWVAATEEEFSAVLRKHTFLRTHDVAAEVFDPQQLKDAEPELRDGLCGALFIPGDSVVYPPAATEFFLNQERISVEKERTVIRLSDHGVHLSNGDFIAAGVVINAAGADALRLSPGIAVTIQPRKGHLIFTDSYPGFLRHQVVELGYLQSARSSVADSVAFNVQPRANGQILVGSSRQYGAYSSDVEEPILHNMRCRAFQYMPRLEQLSTVRTWTGFRPSTSDKLPLIGRCPGFQNVYIAAGHEGLGITTSLGTAKLLLDHILGRTPAIPLHWFSPERPLLASA